MYDMNEDDDDIRLQRVLDANGNETARLICADCGEEWEPPPGEVALVCHECAIELREQYEADCALQYQEYES